MGNALIQVRHLVKHFPVRGGFLNRRTAGYVKAVDDVSLEIVQGETFGLVGESGCGKTTMANLILKLLEPTTGEILYKGQPVSQMSPTETKEYRSAVQAVFQDPYGALNPRMRVRDIVAEPLEVHGVDRNLRRMKVGEALGSVGLPEGSGTQFPHEFSGGQRQRIGIARALVLEPALVVLDEPVSSLDVSIRSQVLNLLKDIQDERAISYLLISHDLAAVEQMSSTIGVMYLGKLVEVAEAETLCDDPLHPYTATLVAASTPPTKTPPWQTPIIGEVPSAFETPAGCAFNPRCPYAMSVCTEVTPPLTQVEPDRWVACHLYPDHIASIDKGGPAPIANPTG